jgi:hypothetical protein
VTESEPICQTSQETINIITDHNRKIYEEISQEEAETDKNLIDEVSSINLMEYLKRRRRIFMLCMQKSLSKHGIITIGDLTQAYEYENDNKIIKTMRLVMSSIPIKLIEIAKLSIEGINKNDEEVNYIMINNKLRKNIDTITTKEIQNLLKAALDKVESIDVKKKVGITKFDNENITKVRKNCNNIKLRSIYFRLIHNDFFTKVKMKKYKMCESDKCNRCGEVETLRHMMWECTEAKKIWNLFNQIIVESGNRADCVNIYDEIFRSCECSGSNVLKLKVTQELIQIERPRGWDKSKILNILKEIMNTEKYNSNRYGTNVKYVKKWKNFEKIIKTV